MTVLMQKYDFYVCQNSVIFGILNGMMELKAGFISKLWWIKLIPHVYVMLKHVLHKPGVIDLFHSSHFYMKL